MIPHDAPFCNPWEHLVRDIRRAIEGEMAAIAVYESLLSMAPNEESRENLTHIRDDEKKHLLGFSNIYRGLTGTQPSPGRPPIPQFATYFEGLKDAYYDELEAAEFYRSILLSTCDPRIGTVVFEAMTDEMEHATRLNRLYFLALHQMHHQRS